VIRSGIPESWHCLDCGIDTAPGCANAAETLAAFSIGEGAPMHFGEDSETYSVTDALWQQATGMTKAGCLCVGCLETCIGRHLTPNDFQHNNERRRVKKVA